MVHFLALTYMYKSTAGITAPLSTIRGFQYSGNGMFQRDSDTNANPGPLQSSSVGDEADFLAVAET